MLIAVRTEIVPIPAAVLAQQLSTNHQRKFHGITTIAIDNLYQHKIIIFGVFGIHSKEGFSNLSF